MQKESQKTALHPRNKNRGRYDLAALAAAKPELKKYVLLNKHGVESIDFSNPKAVKLLNAAILKHSYGIDYWDFPDENLCPPIPGRAEYIHHIADLLAEYNDYVIPTGDTVTCLDIGVGASCIYPIIGISEYKWDFIAADIDLQSIASAQNIEGKNTALKNRIDFRQQRNAAHILKGIIRPDDDIDVVICNPPFHASLEEAAKGSRRKIKNLTGKKSKSLKLNFSGNVNELVYEGGERQFIKTLIAESTQFSKRCKWFTSLVSKESNLKPLYTALEKTNAIQVKTIEILTGNKSSRILAWTFFSDLAKN